MVSPLMTWFMAHEHMRHQSSLRFSRQTRQSPTPTPPQRGSFRVKTYHNPNRHPDGEARRAPRLSRSHSHSDGKAYLAPRLPNSNRHSDGEAYLAPRLPNPNRHPDGEAYLAPRLPNPNRQPDGEAYSAPRFPNPDCRCETGTVNVSYLHTKTESCVALLAEPVFTVRPHGYSEVDERDAAVAVMQCRMMRNSDEKARPFGPKNLYVYFRTRDAANSYHYLKVMAPSPNGMNPHLCPSVPSNAA
jgi:hypothetical protein